MKRRSFLKGMLGVASLAIIPTWPVAKTLAEFPGEVIWSQRVDFVNRPGLSDMPWQAYCQTIIDGDVYCYADLYDNPVDFNSAEKLFRQCAKVAIDRTKKELSLK